MSTRTDDEIVIHLAEAFAIAQEGMPGRDWIATSIGHVPELG